MRRPKPEAVEQQQPRAVDLAVASVLKNIETAQRLEFEKFNPMTGSWETLSEKYGA